MAATNTYDSPIDFRIGQIPPEQLPPELRPFAEEVYLSMQQIIQALTQFCGIGPQPSPLWGQLAGNPSTLLSGNLTRLYVTCGEAIQYGAVINLYNDAGTLKVRNANATNNTKACHGFCSSSEGGDAGETIEVQLATGVCPINGLTPGTNYFLSTSNGQVAASPAVAAGNIEQYVGVAITDTALFINVGGWVQH